MVEQADTSDLKSDPERGEGSTPSVPTKSCGKCKEVKPLTEFHKSTKKGFQSYCKQYNTAVNIERHRNNKQVFYETNKRTRERRRGLINELKNKPCADCGFTFPPYVMDFDHADPEVEKKANVSQIVFGKLENVIAEIAKCEIVCANCHRIRTYKRQKYR